jgi:hypothetical protein
MSNIPGERACWKIAHNGKIVVARNLASSQAEIALDGAT